MHIKEAWLPATQDEQVVPTGSPTQKDDANNDDHLTFQNPHASITTPRTKWSTQDRTFPIYREYSTRYPQYIDGQIALCSIGGGQKM